MEFWDNCLSALRKQFTEEQYRIFISQIGLRIDGETLTLSTPSSACAGWARRNGQLFETVSSLARSELGMSDPQVVVQRGNGSAAAEPREEPAPRPAAAAAPANDASVSPGGLSAHYTFDSFVQGKANQLAMVAGLSVATGDEARRYNPLFIWGGSGLGKTHLAQAIGNKFRSDRKGRRILYIASNDFVGQVVSAFRNNHVEEFKERFHALDMLIVDDIQQFGGDKVRTQEEFLFLFNFLIDQGRPLILTCDRLPRQIKAMPNRLMSRFQGGMMVSIEPPELELRVGILQRKAEEETGNPLDGDVALFIANKVRSNVRELEGALWRVLAYARFRGVPISLEECRKALADTLAAQPSAVTPELIQQTVADYYKIRPSSLRSPVRTRNIARPRHIAVYLTRELTEMSLPEIGQAFGGRNHTTVLHACRTIENLMKQSPDISQEVKVLRHMITS